MTGTDILITIVVGVVAVAVALLPVVLMLHHEHRDLHGARRWWIRQHGGPPESILDYPQMYNQTTEMDQQEFV